ncbi:MAG: hypothetical protein JWO31_19, partial [Phycisphaerales bacterium]|nr:hypothetical protein [Phycisphaerales bacterium]
MIQDQLLLALVKSKNEAADDVLVEALRLGDGREKLRALDALIQRRTVRGMSGTIALFDRMPEPVQQRVLGDLKVFHPALREAGRSDDPAVRVAAMRLIARGRQGRLAYVLSENLHDAHDQVSRAAADAVVALAKWVADETRGLQRGTADDDGPADPDAEDARRATYAALMVQRPEIEAGVARALDVHRGRHGQDLLRAALLLCDGPAARGFQILTTAKHGGQVPMIRRLQQPPAAEHVDAFLLGASRGHVRSHFGAAFAHLADAPALDAVLRRTHWLADPALRQCVHGVIRGAWWADGDLNRDLSRRRPEEAARIADWVVASGAPDATQDDRLDALRRHAR